MRRRAVLLPAVLSLLVAVACASSQPDARTAVSSQPAAATVYITKTGTKYHADGCRHLAKSRIPIALDEAKKKGYEPCSVCQPPR